MTTCQRNDYRQGVVEVIDLALRAGNAIEARGRRPLHEAFAVEALRALANEAEALIRLAPQGERR